MCDEVPSRDIPDGGISQMLLYSLLDLAAIAFTMLEAAHLASFRAYNRLFVKLAFRRHTADSQVCGVHQLRKCNLRTRKHGGLLAILHPKAGVSMMPCMRLWRFAAYCIRSCSLGLLLQRCPSGHQALVGGSAVARARAPSQEQQSSLPGSLHSWMHLTRSTSFASNSICAVDAHVKIASSCASVASTKIPSLAWETALHTGVWINEDARDLQG